MLLQRAYNQRYHFELTAALKSSSSSSSTTKNVNSPSTAAEMAMTPSSSILERFTCLVSLLARLHEELEVPEACEPSSCSLLEEVEIERSSDASESSSYMVSRVVRIDPESGKRFSFRSVNIVTATWVRDTFVSLWTYCYSVSCCVEKTFCNSLHLRSWGRHLPNQRKLPGLLIAEELCHLPLHRVSCLFFEGSYRYLRVHRYIAAYCVYRGRATILKYRGTGSRETILADHYYTVE
jgi:hypothetical protein